MPIWVYACLVGVAAVVTALFVLRVRHARRRGHPSGPIALSMDLSTVVVVAAVTPFVTSFATAIGQRLGQKVRVKRFRLRARRARSVELEIQSTFQPTIVVELAPDLSDEARVALIELDPRDKALWGHRLRWDPSVAAWIPVPATAGAESRR